MIVRADLKKFFFDKPAVKRAVAPAWQRNLSKAGAFVRRRARSLLRKRKKASPAGSPPSVHSSDPVRTLKYILFGWVPQTNSVVIGPVGLNQVDVLDGKQQSGTVPQLHEFGGTRQVVEVMRRDGTWSRADRRSRRRLAGKPMRVRAATYPARPTMGPALKQEIAAGKIADVWKNSVVKGAA